MWGSRGCQFPSCAQPPRLLCELRQSFPVEGDAMAGPRGRQRHALVKYERVRDVTIEPKSVRLEIGTIWAGREKVDGDVVRTVAGDRKIERLCEPRDLHEGGDAAAVGDVGLGIGHRAGRDIVLELP